MPQTLKIYSRFDGTKVLFEREGTTLREVVIAAVESRANLSGANLYGADLSGANLYGADLSGADLYGANLSGANLSGANLYGANLSRADLYGANLSRANLSGANLSGANLYGANLSGADLSGADLSGANLSGADLYRADLYRANLSGADLSGANLSGADLSGADLSGADLYRANLSTVKADVWDVLFRAPAEVAGLLESLKHGRVDGSVYEGDCACLVGTIANVAKCHYADLELIKPNSSRPAERWFLAIRKGDTPDTSNVVKLTVEWIEEFQQFMSRAVTILASKEVA